MNNAKFYCYYKHNGTDMLLEGKSSEYLDAEYSITDSSIKLTLKPKAEVELIWAKFDFEHNFNINDKFFANGYQSWSTSKEYVKSDMQDAMQEWIRTLKADKFAGLASDMWLCKPETKKGCFHSHCYTYIKNGENFLFLGSLSEKEAYTIFNADMNLNLLSVRKDLEGLTINSDYELGEVVILNGTEDEVFDKYFDLMGISKENKIDHLSGYTSWYNYFQKIDEKIILRDLNAMDKVKEDVNIFQVDDGYETFVGDWLDPCEKFPHGMKYIADKIHEKGYMAGIWLAPFNVQIRSRTYKEHPDWVIKDAKGRPQLGCQGWGGAYTLDIYNPEVREHIRHFFDVVLNEWGYDMVKLDFLYSECMMPRNNKTRGTIMCEAMDFLRECCGDKLILGCGVPLGAAFGKVDACRISCDVDLKYTGKFYNKMGIGIELPSAQNAMNNSIFRRQLNHRVFLNDPDVFFLRYTNLKFDQDQKLLLAFINHICGNVLFVSDNMEEYVKADFDTVKKIFAKSEYRILDANYVDKNRKIIIKLLDKNGTERLLWFNTDTGMGNQSVISGISPKR